MLSRLGRRYPLVAASLLLALSGSPTGWAGPPIIPGGSSAPTVSSLKNNLPLIQITAPNAQGVSLNTYQQFNVPKSGAILNNAPTATTSQLGGSLGANPNLASGAARLIINEVLSNGPQSTLKGQLEVAGTPAPVIIVNPSGIQCDGCGVRGIPQAHRNNGYATAES